MRKPIFKLTAVVMTVGAGPFLAENNAAMDKMMARMAVKPAGDVDTDFEAMMILQGTAATGRVR